MRQATTRHATRRSWILYGVIFLLTFIADRVTKAWALHLGEQEVVANPWLSFRLMYNRGVTWGMFDDPSTSTFVFVSLFVVGLVVFLGLYTFARWLNNKSILGETLVLSGALSNIVDRVVYQGVVDFIVLHIGDWYWPTFNVADACIVLGVGCMLLAFLQDS